MSSIVVCKLQKKDRKFFRTAEWVNGSGGKAARQKRKAETRELIQKGNKEE